jgi:SpoVK/Ycf46/Vps4 family AAA+-type ATPase
MLLTASAAQRAVAHHTDCTFIRVSGSELVQKYIGEGSRMVRELFVMAREHAPSIIFMDEIDSIGSARMEGGSGGGDSEVQRTMLELLNQLDGFEATNKIKVIMATNRLDILDTALLRPGRIDRKIEFPNPTEESRARRPPLRRPGGRWCTDSLLASSSLAQVDILKIHSRRMNLVRGIDLKKVAEKMGGSSGAETKAVCTEAGMFALRERRVHVTQEDFEMAVAKVMKKDTDKNSAHTGRDCRAHTQLLTAPRLQCRSARCSNESRICVAKRTACFSAASPGGCTPAARAVPEGVISCRWTSKSRALQRRAQPRFRPVSLANRLHT